MKPIKLLVNIHLTTRRGFRRDKASVEALDAMQLDHERHEREYFLTVSKPVRDWTSEDLLRTIDRVRSKMRKAVDKTNWIWSLPSGGVAVTTDRYLNDGRRLSHLHVGTIGWLTSQTYMIWFSTAGGYAARITLPEPPPGSALVPFVGGADRYCDLTIDLNLRAVASAYRSVRSREEREARERMQPGRRERPTRKRPQVLNRLRPTE